MFILINLNVYKAYSIKPKFICVYVYMYIDLFYIYIYVIHFALVFNYDTHDTK